LVKLEIYNKASQNRQQAGWTRFTRLCWQALHEGELEYEPRRN